MVRVLFISSLQALPRILRFADLLKREGHEIHVLEWDRSGELPATEVKDGISFIRYRKASSFGFKVLLQFLGWVLFQIIHLTRNDYDVIHPQNLDSLIPALLSLSMRGKRSRLLYDMADFYADAYLNFPVVKKLISALERILVKKS
ncbi:MAG: hypothetical protein NZ992_03420 [Candidatus Korarchaeum sp.]|nr:hypothetical protein [Candidatus Korarchaeum sp.]